MVQEYSVNPVAKAISSHKRLLKKKPRLPGKLTDQ